MTKNMLFDFTAANYYTGVGLDLVSGPWEQKFWIANFNSGRNDTNLAAATSGNTGQPGLNTTPAFIYYVGYYQEEYWGLESTVYLVPSTGPGAATGTTTGRLAQVEIDGNYTRGTFNFNMQVTAGNQINGALGIDPNTGAPMDSTWYGLSTMVSKVLGSNWVVAGRMDYLNNQSNGGGIFPLVLSGTNPGGVVGDVVNGFIQDPADPTGTTGTNRAALTFAATYRLNPNAALRGELRRDFASTSAFYNWNSGTYQSTNNTVGLQAIVNF